MYKQQSSSLYGSSAGSMGNQSSTSQYRGSQNQKPFQPIGMVQSQYGQRASQYGSGQTPSAAAGGMQSSAGGFQSTSSFHTANYRGNQPGHDSYLRSDSRTPSQSGAIGIGSGYGSGTMSQSNQAFGMGQSGSGQAAGAAFQSTSSFHTAGYRGNQPGHDSYLRSDSQHPSQAQTGYASFGMAQSQFQPQQSSYQQHQNQYQPQNQFHFQNQMQNQQQNQMQNQNQSFASTQSFHTAGYRGNQPGHDAYLRSDSNQPASSYSSIGGTSSFRF
ncbi:hypothetical protein [Paenibacillus oceani]|nr:hypothetical protein [Paenibacillus oceani]